MMSLPVWLPGPMFLPGVSVSGPMFLPGDLCPEGTLPEGSVRGLCSGGLVRETTQTETPPYGEERTVHILLECILIILFKLGDYVLRK